MPLELRIENTGRVPVKIKNMDLWSEFSYTFRGRDDGGAEPLRVGGCGRSGLAGPNEFLVIEPGMTQTLTFDHPLEKVFFYDSGKYTISTTVSFQDPRGQNYALDSNEVELELFDCGGRPESEQ